LKNFFLSLSWRSFCHFNNGCNIVGYKGKLIWHESQNNIGREGCEVWVQWARFEENFFYETGHDEQDKYVWMISQDIDNLNESYYILEKQKKTNQNLTYDHCMDEGMGSRDTQKYEEKHN